MEVEVGYDLVSGAQLRVRLEALHAAGQTNAETAPVTITGRGTRRLVLAVPEARLADPHYLSSPEGGEYRLRALLEP